MTKSADVRGSREPMMILLSRLLLSPLASRADSSELATVAAMDQPAFDTLVDLASTNHVIIRAMEILEPALRERGDALRAGWAAAALAQERERISTAIEFLGLLCDTFDEEGLDVTVMKSLDHWPDLGSDLDLYTNSSPAAVCAMMQRRFGAHTSARSWGDRLACKWNFEIDGLPEPVEIHMGRLGQTGEQIVLASHLPQRSRRIQVGKRTFRVPSASDRLMISTLQRMYRHFYFRLCDIVDSMQLAESGILDYDELRASAQAAGIWEGVATYLAIVSEYVGQYRGKDLELPAFVQNAARFGGDLVTFGRDFLRVPIMPQSAGLYGTQLVGFIRRRELRSSARLGLLPWLATAAAVGMKLTGSDKGIW